MEERYLFLEHLGLDAGADARAIRRAYARALKRIDQQHDPRGFQQLRDSYETALAWAAWMQARQDEPAPAGCAEMPPGQTPLPEASPAGAPPDIGTDPKAGMAQGAATMAAAAPPTPWDVGRSAFEAFRAAMPELLRGHGRPPERPWIAALEAVLADERMLNFDTRLSFEAHLAHLLVEGWRSGHEILLPACVQVFGWDRDRRALARLGQTGAALDQALEEGAAFAAQPGPVRGSQRDVLAALRESEAPDMGRIQLGMAALEQMAQGFPHWLPLVAPAANVGYWRERQREKGKAFEVQDLPQPPRRPAQGKHFVWAGAMVLLLLLRACEAGTFQAGPAAHDLPSAAALASSLADAGFDEKR